MSRFAMFVLMVPFVMALAAMVPLVAIAQTPRSAGAARPMDGRLERLSEQLKLTAGQKEQIKPILDEEMQRLQDLRGDASQDRRGRVESMRKLREERSERIKAVLTDEQKQQYDRMEQEQRNRMKERMRSRRSRDV